MESGIVFDRKLKPAGKERVKPVRGKPPVVDLEFFDVLQNFLVVCFKRNKKVEPYLFRWLRKRQLKKYI